VHRGERRLKHLHGLGVRLRRGNVRCNESAERGGGGIGRPPCRSIGGRIALAGHSRVWSRSGRHESLAVVLRCFIESPRAVALLTMASLFACSQSASFFASAAVGRPPLATIFFHAGLDVGRRLDMSGMPGTWIAGGQLPASDIAGDRAARRRNARCLMASTNASRAAPIELVANAHGIAYARGQPPLLGVAFGALRAT